jgi:hypothetical protein
LDPSENPDGPQSRKIAQIAQTDTDLDLTARKRVHEGKWRPTRKIIGPQDEMIGGDGRLELRQTPRVSQLMLPQRRLKTRKLEELTGELSALQDMVLIPKIERLERLRTGEPGGRRLRRQEL